MKSQPCTAQKYVRRATKQKPYHYKLSGLSAVYLIGIDFECCDGCGAEVPTIPRIGELHRVIAQDLLCAPAALKGEEIRFLRKQVAVPAREFAAMACIAPETLSRFENDKLRPSDAVEKLIRTIATGILLRGEEVRDALLKLARLKMASQRSGDSAFVLEKHRWRPAA